MKTTRPKYTSKTANKFELDIAQEFKDVKHEIVGLKNEISNWQKTVEKQLTKLNDNMEKVLNTLADHELRLD